ncbi:methyltransferase [Streptomyces albireticuli]|uniref:methyltransferase n=1 Tax=Streptomyces albireticuli TaxID=1940 RepID=UPI001476756A|nr:methyltransferase [Streptomyces albireticuli]MCD9140887.1 acetylserotonin O-methyltransferase [Streptomyces albireticuli]MCD9161151.1 acetylserotonin O-methyltransferase [Streptomyces albireticuli]MCD9190791.1 acetylserotonin O-methyltransferase [Streptomyces albireticuli]
MPSPDNEASPPGDGTPSPGNGTSASDDLFQLVFRSAPWTFQSLYVTARLGLADLLGDGPLTSDELAVATESDADALYRFCRAVAALGLFREHPGRIFELTSTGEAFRGGGLAQFTIVNGAENFRSWADVMYSVRTGKPAFDRVYGMPAFAFLDRDEEARKVFHTMVGRGTVPPAVDSCDFSSDTTVVDLGGSVGTLLAHVLRERPELRGVLQDLPSVVGEAPTVLAGAGVAGRVEIVGRSFFDGVPAGGSTYVLSRVLHDWGDEDALRILRNVRAAMTEDSRLVVIDQVIPEGGGFHPGKFSDLQMLVVLGGRERTVEEFRGLLLRAGLKIRALRPPADDPAGSPRTEAVIEAGV